MAEFCLDCWNKINDMDDNKWRYIFSLEMELCEGCGCYKRVIVAERLWSKIQRILIDIMETIK